MRLFTCNGGWETPDEAKALTVEGFRIGVPKDARDAHSLDNWMATFLRPEFAHIFIIYDPWAFNPLMDAIETHGYDASQSFVEVTNEPPGVDNTWCTSAQIYARAITDVYKAAAIRSFTGTIMAGAKLNLSADSIAWYKAACPLLPSDCWVAYHGYPKGTQEQDGAWSDSHEQDLDNLRRVAGGRTLAETEAGQHTFPERQGFHTVQQSEADIYRWLLKRLKWNQAQGIALTAVYAWQDDPRVPNSGVGWYGIHDKDGNRKQQAQALIDWRTA